MHIYIYDIHTIIHTHSCIHTHNTYKHTFTHTNINVFHMFISNIVNDLIHTFDRSMVSYNIDLMHYTSHATIMSV